jgi:hypothetical protein
MMSATKDAAPRAATNGYLDADSLIQNAPKDILEEDVEGVFGGKVRVRGLTAQQSMKVEQAGVRMDPISRRVQMMPTEALILKFELGVVAPKMDHTQATIAYQNAGQSFLKVTQAIDRLSGTGDEEMLKALSTFPGSEES